jgi:hypothetical protein
MKNDRATNNEKDCSQSLIFSGAHGSKKRLSNMSLSLAEITLEIYVAARTDI